MRLLRWIAILPLVAPAQSKPGNAPDIGELFQHVAQTYESLQHYQFEIHETPGEGIVKLAAILPDSIYFYSQGLKEDVECANSPHSAWRLTPGTHGGPAPLPPDPGLRGRNICRHEFSAAEEAFVDRWKRISEWAGDSTIRGEGTVSISKSKFRCWIVDIQSNTNADRTELWIDQSRYLVLREVFENRPEHRHLRREWMEARLDALPDESLFLHSSKNQPRR
jgi:hypothetical protein